VGGVDAVDEIDGSVGEAKGYWDNLISRCICDNVLYGGRIDVWMITRDGGFECNLFYIETVFIIRVTGRAYW
jgi:hypothetical protein